MLTVRRGQEPVYLCNRLMSGLTLSREEGGGWTTELRSLGVTESLWSFGIVYLTCCVIFILYLFIYCLLLSLS